MPSGTKKRQSHYNSGGRLHASPLAPQWCKPGILPPYTCKDRDQGRMLPYRGLGGRREASPHRCDFFTILFPSYTQKQHTDIGSNQGGIPKSLNLSPK